MNLLAVLCGNRFGRGLMCLGGVRFDLSEAQRQSMLERLVETVIHSDAGLGGGKIAIIEVEGMILNMRTSPLFGSGENMVAVFQEKLDRAAEDPRVLSGVAPLQTAQAEHVSFLDNRRYLAALRETKAGAVIVHPDLRWRSIALP